MKDDRDYEALARLIVARMEQGWDSEAERLYDRARNMGFDMRRLQDAMFDIRYGKGEK